MSRKSRELQARNAHLKAIMLRIRAVLIERGIITRMPIIKRKRMISLFLPLAGIKTSGATAKDHLIKLYLEGHIPLLDLTDDFYGTPRWIAIREIVLERYGNYCMKCGALSDSPHIDHIKPRSKYPSLQYDLDNLQVFCPSCNFVKGNRGTVDYRPPHKDLRDLV